MVPSSMTSVDEETDMLTSLGETGPLLGHIMTAL